MIAVAVSQMPNAPRAEAVAEAATPIISRWFIAIGLSVFHTPAKCNAALGPAALSLSDYTSQFLKKVE